MNSVKRVRNINILGDSWPETEKNMVWNKAIIIPNYPKDVYRLDHCGRIICFDYFGNENHSYGWEIDHIIPIGLGGKDDLTNLQPLHWSNNLNKGDELDWVCEE